jgi:hypothetical protein
MEIDYDKVYKAADIKEMKEWFAAQKLPQSMQVDKCTFIPNLKRTVDALIEQSEYCYGNPNLHGCLYVLERIRLRLLKQTDNKTE